MLPRGRHVSRLNSQVEEEDNIREERYGATALPLLHPHFCIIILFKKVCFIRDFCCRAYIFYTDLNVDAYFVDIRGWVGYRPIFRHVFVVSSGC